MYRSSPQENGNRRSGSSPAACVFGTLHRRPLEGRLRCYMLHNHDLPFDIVVGKLKVFERLRPGPVYSRFRPSTVLCDGYIPQKRGRGDDEHYIHTSWSDRQVRIIGSLASDISRMACADADSFDEVRRYYGKTVIPRGR